MGRIAVEEDKEGGGTEMKQRTRKKRKTHQKNQQRLITERATVTLNSANVLESWRLTL